MTALAKIPRRKRTQQDFPDEPSAMPKRLIRSLYTRKAAQRRMTLEDYAEYVKKSRKAHEGRRKRRLQERMVLSVRSPTMLENLSNIPSSTYDTSPRVLFLSTSDYACMGYTLARALEAVGVGALAICTKPSPRVPLNKQAMVCPRNVLYGLIHNAQVIVWMHSVLTRLPKNIIRGKKLVVFHGGTRYRKNAPRLAAKFNFMVDLSLTQTGELLNRGAKNEHWLLPPVDTEGILPDYSFSNARKLVIGHFPSHRSNLLIKGTNLITSVMSSLNKGPWRDKFIFRTRRNAATVPWEHNLKEMAQCDIYIESLSHAEPRNTNKHDWSVQALEACALGCITITNFKFANQYKKVYGDHGLLVANSGDALKSILIKLFQKDRAELLALKERSRRWVEISHSYVAIGRRLKAILQLQ